MEGTEKDVDGKDDKMKTTEETFGEDEALGENESKDRFSNVVSDSLAAPVTKPETDPETDTVGSTVGNVMETAEEKEDVTASKSGNDETPAGEATGGSTSDGHAASLETAMPELPKVIKSVLLQLTSGPSSVFTEVCDFLFDQVTQEMVNALLVECRTRTASHPNNTSASTNGEQGRTQTETEQGKEAAEETKEVAKNHTQEEVKKQEKERKEREARKERERKDRERRVWEKEERSRKEREREERARREREKREEERREWERRERERRERKRSHGERSSGRMEGNKQSVRRDGHNSKTVRGHERSRSVD